MPSSNEWYYAQDGQQRGPMPAEAVGQLLREGKLTGEDLVWAEGMTTWQPARGVQQFAASPPAGGVGPLTGGYAGPTAAPVPPLSAPPAVTPVPPYGAQPFHSYYGVQPIPYRPGGGSSNGLATAGFVFSLFMPLIGLIISLIALSNMKTSGNYEGRGLAKAGLIISLGWFGLGLLMVCLVFVVGIATVR